MLVSDDCGQDDTYEVAICFANGSTLPMTVIRHEQHLGYGSHQKTGYDWAIVRGEADAVLGSRMMARGAARSGGMPLCKRVGNRVLTTFQNAVAGFDLTEWHSGYRAYRVEALRHLDLAAFADGFDIEIILGLHAHGSRILEVPIPTFHRDEICYVNGMAYAARVATHVVRFRADRMWSGARRDSQDVAPTPCSPGESGESGADDPRRAAAATC